MINDNLEHNTAHVNGQTLHYVSAGSGPLVLLLHGFPEFWYSWRHQIGPLAQHGRVVAVDQRGYNLSSKPAGIAAYAIDQLVADVVGLIDHFGAEQATLVGHDWGGAVAWATAIAHPERLRQLAVLNLPHPLLMLRALRRNPRQMLRSWYMGFFQLPRLPEWLMERGSYAFLKRAFTSWAPGTFSDEDLAAYQQAWSQPGALRAMVNWYRTLRAPIPKRYTATGHVPVPTLLIWATGDRALGQELTYGTERYVPDLRIRYLNGISHWVQQEAPATVNAELLSFLSCPPGATVLP